ncbi:uncharacterized protein LOC114223500 isoform X2 [Eumetopias jubatus]|uniref:uncharacterized protein LOC114223500 isoform X2 n=1 Tax=Eumetopias jubatus TaxID=34886 RepID=UPI0010160A5F|nr:uncharacterized protein LOC114223500 isoform X2 [Eumetopias jubatus]
MLREVLDHGRHGGEQLDRTRDSDLPHEVPWPRCAPFQGSHNFLTTAPAGVLLARPDGVSDSRTKVCPRPLPSTVQHTHSQCVPCNGSRQQEGSLSASSQPSPSPSSPQQPRCSSKIYDESDNVRGHKLLSAQRALELAAMAAEWGISSLSRQGGVLRPQGAGRGSRACQAFPAPAPEEGSFHSCQLRPLLTAPAQRETRRDRRRAGPVVATVAHLPPPQAQQLHLPRVSGSPGWAEEMGWGHLCSRLGNLDRGLMRLASPSSAPHPTMTYSLSLP